MIMTSETESRIRRCKKCDRSYADGMAIQCPNAPGVNVSMITKCKATLDGGGWLWKIKERPKQ